MWYNRGISRRLGMLIGVVDGVEVGMRIAEFRSTCLKIMHQGMHPARADVRVMFGVPGAVEKPVWVTPFRQAMPDEMDDRVEVCRDDVGVLRLVPIGVEKRFEGLRKRGFAASLRSFGTGRRC